MKDQRGNHIEPNYEGFRCLECGEYYPDCVCRERDDDEYESQSKPRFSGYGGGGGG